MRKMARHIVDPRHWPELSDETSMFLEYDAFAHMVYEMMREEAANACAWYDDAETDAEITRWVPQDGGGDCYLIYPGDSSANECEGMYDVLVEYASRTNRNAYEELDAKHSAFFTYDMSESE